ncbi:hypothetical protein BKA70DRAFT_1255110 [Coprinopsis sp. MPI-PUGE-AT-0042]|nr:hypothetical protein BKA70DRAFT_1255110 [Coprinopsis sp. MPI-PUGE-AT-0042]
MASLYLPDGDYKKIMAVSSKAVDQAISRASGAQEAKVDDLLLLVKALRSEQSLKYIPECLDIFLRHLRLPEPRSGDKEPLPIPQHVVALAGLSVIMIHTQIVPSVHEKIWPKLKKHLDVFLECIDDGLRWCSSPHLEAGDISESTTYPEIQPARFPYTATFMLARVLAFGPGVKQTVTSKPLAIKIAIRVWLLKNTNVSESGRRIRYKDGSGSDNAYLMHLSDGDVFLCPILRFFGGVLFTYPSQLYKIWKLDCTENGILLEDLIAETLASRVNTLKLWSRKERKTGVPVLWGHFRTICDLVTAFRREAHIAAGQKPDDVDNPEPSTLDVPLLQRRILPDLTRVTITIGEQYRKNPLWSDFVFQHDLPPVVLGATRILQMFIPLNHCTPRGAYAHAQVLETVRAGFIPLLIGSLDKLCDYPTFELHTLFPKAEPLDYWQATWMCLHYVLSYSVYPSILQVARRDWAAIPKETLAKISRRMIKHPAWTFGNEGLSKMGSILEEWHTCHGDFEKLKSFCGLLICDNPTHTKAIKEAPSEAIADPEPTKQCSGCSSVLYCSTTCQKADWKAGHRDQCQVQSVNREERKLNQIWYNHQLRAWHMFMITWLYRAKKYYAGHTKNMKAGAMHMITFNFFMYPPRSNIVLVPMHYTMRGISGNPAQEAQLEEMFKRAGYELLLEDEREKEGRPLWPRIRLVEGVFLFGQNALCVTMQFRIKSVSDDNEQVDMEMIQAVTRIGQFDTATQAADIFSRYGKWFTGPKGQKQVTT